MLSFCVGECGTSLSSALPTTSTGKSTYKNACKNASDPTKIGACKRNHSIGNILDTNYTANHAIKCPCAQQTLITSCTNRHNLNNNNLKTHGAESKRQSICTLDHPSSHAHPLAHIKPIDGKKMDGQKIDLLSPKNGCKPLSVYNSGERVTIACGLLGSRSNPSSMRPKSCHLPIGTNTSLTIVDIDTDNSRSSQQLSVAEKNASLLSVDSSFSVGGSSGGSIANASSASPNSPGTISLSKSETNIFEGSDTDNKLAIYNVVSLNDLNESDAFCNRRQMNDLSKNQVLNNISEFEIRGHARDKCVSISHEMGVDKLV